MATHVKTPQAERKAHRFTREEYEQMVEAGIFDPDDRLELLEGELVEKMTHNASHATGVRKARRALQGAYSLDHFIVDSQLPLALRGSESEPEPDVSVIEGAIEDFQDRHPSTAVLVVEVSDASLADDRIRKQRIYARDKIAEYWIVNLADECLEVYREPGGDAYQSKETLRSGDEVTPPEASAAVAVADLLP